MSKFSVTRALGALILGFVLAGFSTAYASFPLAYVGYSDVRDIALSPDGSSVVTLNTQFYEGIRSRRDWDDIVFRSTETGEITYTHDIEYRLYYWVSWPVDEIILTQALVYDIGRRNAKTQVKLLAIDPKDGTERVLYSGDKGNYKKERKIPRIMGISTKSREIALRVEDGKRRNLIAINIDSGETRLLARGTSKTIDWEMDENLRPYLRTDEGRRENETRVYVLNDEGDWVLRRSYNSFENNFRAASYVTEDEEMLVVHRPDGAQQSALYLYDLGNDVYKEALFEVEGHDIVTSRRTKFDGQLMYVGWYEDKLEKEWFDEDFESAGKALDKALKPEDNWSIVETSADNRHWLLFVSSPTRPGIFLYYNLDTKRARVLGNIRPDLKSGTVFPLQRIDYTAADGTELFGYFLQTKRGAEAPLIVMPHGGPVARDYADFDGMAQFLTYKGYNVFLPQFRGGGELGLSFEEAGHGEWGRAMQTDIEDGVTSLINQGLVSPQSGRIILGASYGGYAALAGATLTPENYGCAISINGVSDLPMMLNSYDRTDPDDEEVYQVWVKRIGDPETELERILAVSPRQQMSNAIAPILLIHGTDDDIVDIEQSRAAFSTLQQLGHPVVLHELDGAGHNIDDEDQRTEMLAMIDRFLLECMPPW